MQQFTVPQFIDVEDKIIGPVTTRQFIIMLVCFILIAVYYKVFDFTLFVTATVITFCIFGIVAFAKINGRPFHFFILNLIQTFKKPGLRVWNHKVAIYKDDYKTNEQKIMINNINVAPKEKPTERRLSELSLIMDTQGKYEGEN